MADEAFCSINSRFSISVLDEFVMGWSQADEPVALQFPGSIHGDFWSAAR